MRQHLGLPPLHVCSICEAEVDLNSSLTLRMVRGWARNNKKTLVHVTEQEPKFAHEHCLRFSNSDDSPTLF